MATRFEIISQMVVRSIASDKNIEVLRIGLLKPNLACLPLGWISKPEIILIDEALSDYDVVWAAAGHPHAVYPTTYDELIQCTGAQPIIVGD